MILPGIVAIAAILLSGCEKAGAGNTTATAGLPAAVHAADPIRLYILRDSGTQALAAAQISNLDGRLLELARNEIYARHGYVFKRKDLRDYFGAKPWYHASSDYKDDLSPVEKQNVELLRVYEAKYAAYKLVAAHSDDYHLRNYEGNASFKGQQMEVDLDGDGIDERVRLIPPASEMAPFRLKVNDAVIEIDSELLPYFDVVDLDVDDPYLEIAVQMDSNMVSWRNTSFYEYAGRTIKLMGVLPDFSAHSSMFDGHGRVVSAEQGRTFQTWYRDAVFQLGADRKLHEQQQDFYPMEPPTPLTIKKEVIVQRSKGDEKETYALQPGDSVKFLGSDEREYAKLETSAGDIVWYFTGNEYAELTDFFDGLILYG
ncbi:hypothetical protein COHCIP112018_04778 [Cohnella sp. JJ-181]|nr:hypothetical protein COHCIP112018_04778 [Cohnella sp. JJ-181]